MLSFVLVGLVLVGPRTHGGLVASSVSASLFLAFYQDTQFVLIDHNRVSARKGRKHPVSVCREVDLLFYRECILLFHLHLFLKCFGGQTKKDDEICWADRNPLRGTACHHLGHERDAFLWRQHQDLVSSQCL